MKSLHPQLTLSRWSQNVMTWTGPIRPSALGEEYQVRITYKLGEKPQVTVVSPELHGRENGSRIPHVYPGKRLCLYFPAAREWGPDKLIADTIVPWAALWLYHYENWHATGEWLGGGIHPTVKEE
jgi:hypothetical protein